MFEVLVYLRRSYLAGTGVAGGSESHDQSEDGAAAKSPHGGVTRGSRRATEALQLGVVHPAAAARQTVDAAAPRRPAPLPAQLSQGQQSPQEAR